LSLFNDSSSYPEPLRLAVPLRPVAGFPGLRLLRGLRPPRHQPSTGLSWQGHDDAMGFPRSRCSVWWGKCPAIPLQVARCHIAAPAPPPAFADRSRPT